MERSYPALFTHRVPPEGQPKVWPAIAAVFDKFNVFSVRYEARGELEILHKLPVPRLLVVVKKSGASVPDLINSPPVWHPPYRRNCGAHCFCALAKDGAQRGFGEYVFDVGQHQLLMLLFVIDAQDNNGRELLEEILIFQNAFHQPIYFMSVF